MPVPRSEWVVASGYIRGGVSLVNTKTFAATQVFPVAKPVERFDKSTYSQCPGPVDPGEKEKLSAHGLAIRPGADRVHTVYLVHHGFRESIEVFEIDTRPATPTFTWIGCVIAPETAAFNSVTPLAGGGFAATNPNRRVKPQPGADPTNTGEIWEWNPKSGFAIIPGSEGNGPNGIEASPDGRWLYVNHWPAQEDPQAVARPDADRQGIPRRELPARQHPLPAGRDAARRRPWRSRHADRDQVPDGSVRRRRVGRRADRSEGMDGQGDHPLPGQSRNSSAPRSRCRSARRSGSAPSREIGLRAIRCRRGWGRRPGAGGSTRWAGPASL